MDTPLNVFEVSPNHCWDNLPTGTRWHDIREVMVLEANFRDLIRVNWSSGPGNYDPWLVDEFQRSMRLLVVAGYFKEKHEIKCEWVSQIVLASGTLYNVTPTSWVVS